MTFGVFYAIPLFCMTTPSPKMPQGNDEYNPKKDFWLNVIVSFVQYLGMQDVIPLDYKKMPKEEIEKIIFDKILNYKDYKSGLEILKEFNDYIENINRTTPKGEKKTLASFSEMNTYTRLHQWEIEGLVEVDWIEREDPANTSRKKGYRKVTGGQRVDSPEISGDESFSMA